MQFDFSTNFFLRRKLSVVVLLDNVSFTLNPGLQAALKKLD